MSEKPLMALTTKSLQKSFGGTQGVYTHQSNATQCEMEFSVYLPQQSKADKCPVVYYLSGLTCTQENVTTKAGFQKVASELGLVIVCPDTSPRGTNYPEEHTSYDFGSGAGFYLNATQAPWSKSYRMYDYIVKELPSLIAANFSIDREQCAIMGHSMGGHGALTIGLRNPNLFQSLSAFSPIVAPMSSPWGMKAFKGYLGEDTEAWKNYDATQLILAGYRSKNKILIDQGSADNFLNEQLKPELLVEACLEKNQQLDYRLQKGYDHSYYFISSFIQQHLEFHLNNFSHTQKKREIDDAGLLG